MLSNYLQPSPVYLHTLTKAQLVTFHLVAVPPVLSLSLQVYDDLNNLLHISEIIKTKEVKY